MIGRFLLMRAAFVVSYLLLVAQCDNSPKKREALIQSAPAKSVKVFYPKTCLSQEKEIELIKKAISEAK